MLSHQVFLIDWCIRCVFLTHLSKCSSDFFIAVWREGSLCQQVYKGAFGVLEWTVVVCGHLFIMMWATISGPSMCQSQCIQPLKGSHQTFQLPEMLRHLDFTFLKKEVYWTAHLFFTHLPCGVGAVEWWYLIWHFTSWVANMNCNGKLWQFRDQINLYLSALMTWTPNLLPIISLFYCDQKTWILYQKRKHTWTGWSSHMECGPAGAPSVMVWLFYPPLYEACSSNFHAVHDCSPRLPECGSPWSAYLRSDLLLYMRLTPL